MVNHTRKVRRGGGIFNTLRGTFRGTLKNDAIVKATNERNRQLAAATQQGVYARSKARIRVANTLGVGSLSVKPTNRQQIGINTNAKKLQIEQDFTKELANIEAKYGEQIQSSARQLFTKESVEKLKEFFSLFQGAIQKANELRAPQVTLTLPTGLAKPMIALLKIAAGLALIFCGVIIGFMAAALGSADPFDILYFGVNLLTLKRDNEVRDYT